MPFSSVAITVGRFYANGITEAVFSDIRVFDDASSCPPYMLHGGFLIVALPRLQLFFKCVLMPDEQSCNPLPEEVDCTPKRYERAYHGCKLIHLASNMLSPFDPL